MASELSQLIESELRKAEGANKPDEHQRRLASLRIKTGLEQPPPGLLQKLCTPKRQVISAAVVTVFVLLLIVVAAAHRRHTSGSLERGDFAAEYEPLTHSNQTTGKTITDLDSAGLVGAYEVEDISANDDDVDDNNDIRAASLDDTTDDPPDGAYEADFPP